LVAFLYQTKKKPLGDIILKYIVLVLTFNCFPATMSKWVFFTLVFGQVYVQETIKLLFTLELTGFLFIF